MENENLPDPYEAVIADLRSQRERIDEAISLLEGLRGRAGVKALTGGIGAAVAAGANKFSATRRSSSVLGLVSRGR
jgi:hypothetical protein